MSGRSSKGEITLELSEDEFRTLRTALAYYIDEELRQQPTALESELYEYLGDIRLECGDE